MRDPKRIDRVTTALHRMWRRHPELRLGQLLVAVVGKPSDLFYLEDDKLEYLLSSGEGETDDA